ncbi:AAA family ATPase [Archangium gephyra]|uniref:AAA family ATPase n=1 Tax=Archangium gephyra TaxID=48 RepID=UPI003B7DBF0C
MLTRLKIDGFKNLKAVDIRFGPFTCVAGGNGVGKSNLFDAIRFLSALADRPLLDAALSVRSEGGVGGDLRSIFHHVGERYGRTMSFEVEMLVPRRGVDDLGQEAKASITFLRYELELEYREDEGGRSLDGLQIRHESLKHISLGDAKAHLPFDHSFSWRRSVVTGRRTSPFISTERSGEQTYIKLHGDGGKVGRTRQFLAESLPRTVLSSTTAAESPTALLARREMQSWRLLQLEPSALRAPDPYSAPSRLGTSGAHLPATLGRLAQIHRGRREKSGVSEQIYTRIANRLAQLVEGIRSVRIDADERRELLTLVVRDRDGTEHEARGLSDGTLRFLALCVLESDPEAQGLLCLEEPENGIHPERIPAMIRLMQDLAVDVDEPIGPDNPLRQVIINTHSPAVVSIVPDDSLVVAASEPMMLQGERFSVASFRWLPDTWRDPSTPQVESVSRGKLLAYLNPLGVIEQERRIDKPKERKTGKRVMERLDLQMMLPLPTAADAS